MSPGEEASPPLPSSPLVAAAVACRKIRALWPRYYRHLTSGMFLFEIKRLTNFYVIGYRLPSPRAL